MSTDSRSRLSVAVLRSIGDGRPQEGDQLLPAFDAPARVHEPPTGVAHHALPEQARQGEQALHDPAQGVLHDHEVVGVGRAELFDLALEGAHRHPGVGRQLVAHGLGRTQKVPHGVGQRARAVLVDHQGEQLGAGSGEPIAGPLPDEARVGGADPGEGGEQHLEAFGAGGVGAPLEVVAPVVRRPHETGHGLGPLGVAAHPEQVLGGPRRHRRRRVDGGHRGTGRQPEPGELLRFGGEHPGVLADGAGLVGDPGAARGCGGVARDAP